MHFIQLNKGLLHINSEYNYFYFRAYKEKIVSINCWNNSNDKIVLMLSLFIRHVLELLSSWKNLVNR